MALHFSAIPFVPRHAKPRKKKRRWEREKEPPSKLCLDGGVSGPRSPGIAFVAEEECPPVFKGDQRTFRGIAFFACGANWFVVAALLPSAGRVRDAEGSSATFDTIRHVLIN